MRKRKSKKLLLFNAKRRERGAVVVVRCESIMKCPMIELVFCFSAAVIVYHMFKLMCTQSDTKNGFSFLFYSPLSL